MSAPLVLKADNGRALDLLAHTCARVKSGESVEAACAWVYFMGMTPQDRLDFDCFLVRMGDELAYQAGTPEHRFRERVRRMVSA